MSSRKTPPSQPSWLTVIVGLAVAVSAVAGTAGHVGTVPAAPPANGCVSTTS